MTIPFWCLLGGIILPFVLAGASSYYRLGQLGSLDNKDPRKQQAALEGPGARVVAAQQNAWEALTVFACAVFVSHLAGADAGTAANLSLGWLASRVLHPILYVANLDLLRSVVFLGGFACAIGLFVISA